jgi:SAM-dependent methyltransferase
MTNAVGSRQEVERFLASTSFTGYQSVPLPHGLRVPGTNRKPSVDIALAGNVAGKTVLDVGTYYGYLPYEAARQGAALAVGVESDPGRWAIAERIAELHGRPYSVRLGRIEELTFEQRFDLVTVLNVVHHVSDPVAFMHRIASLSKQHVVVEFCLVDDPAYLREHFAESSRSSVTNALRVCAATAGLSVLQRLLPLLAVGNRPGDRTMYFTEAGFRNLFVLHNKMFQAVEFRQSPITRHRAIAICSVTPRRVVEK